MKKREKPVCTGHFIRDKEGNLVAIDPRIHPVGAKAKIMVEELKTGNRYVVDEGA